MNQETEAQGGTGEQMTQNANELNPPPPQVTEKSVTESVKERCCWREANTAYVCTEPIIEKDGKPVIFTGSMGDVYSCETHRSGAENPGPTKGMVECHVFLCKNPVIERDGKPVIFYGTSLHVYVCQGHRGTDERCVEYTPESAEEWRRKFALECDRRDRELWAERRRKRDLQEGRQTQ